MSPRPGGEADKFGARYEGAWTVWHVLEVVAGRGLSITVEVAGEIEEGAEFLFQRVSDGVTEAHQVKRQNGNANGWTVKSLQDLGVWSNARRHFDRGREFHFVSTIPARKLTELADRARRSANLDDFIKKDWLTKELRPQFDDLAKEDLFGSPAAAWDALCRMHLHSVDEETIVSHNAAMSEALLEGAAGRLSSVGLGDIAWQNIGVSLTDSAIGLQLGSYGLRRATVQRAHNLRETVANITRNWRESVRRELLVHSIERSEIARLVDLMKDSRTQISFVVGTAGAGKSAILLQALDQIVNENLPALAFRLDRFNDFNTTAELKQKLGLDISPVPALASAAGDKPSVLVIDQLDAVSLASGRTPDSFNTVEDLVREATAFPNMHVVLACRKYDLDNDYRIRTLAQQLTAETVDVTALSDNEINSAVQALALDHTMLTAQQRALLRLPLHLVLLAGVADQADALDFKTTAHLFDAYWRRKHQMIHQRKPDIRFMEVIVAVTTAMSDRQLLSVSDSVLDAENLAGDGEAFISEHVLVRDGNRIAFFHEAFFDYAFARQWASTKQSLVDFLTVGEQELFRRAQVRQILNHLRERDRNRYLAELKSALTSPAIRFHIKEAMLTVVGNSVDPSAAELRILLHAAENDSILAARIWANLHSEGWFARLDSGKVLDDWLNSPLLEERERAIGIMAYGSRTDPDRVAEILSSYKANPNYPEWLLGVGRLAEIYESRILFDLFLDSVRVGEFDGQEGRLWLSMHGLADHEPIWAIELIRAYLVEWPGGMTADSSGSIARLKQGEHDLAEMIRASASVEPRSFVAAILPYMTAVMQVTAIDYSPPGFPTDRHFSNQYSHFNRSSETNDALWVAMCSAIESLISEDAIKAKVVLENLGSLRLASAQSLLYHGLIFGKQSYASWAADLLLEGIDRLFCGTGSSSAHVVRQLIAAIAPGIDDIRHAALEDLVRELRFDWEERDGGRYAFFLLSALEPNRLTPLGARRLGEYERKFGRIESPDDAGARGGSIGPPISGEAVALMTDEDWIRAIARHNVDRTDWSTLTGGARELSLLLHQATKKDPLRFAGLTQRLEGTMNSAYGNAILQGLGEAVEVALSDQTVVFEAVERIASFGQPSNDRWLGHALRPYLKSVPPVLVELIRDRAVSAPDPEADQNDGFNEREPGERLRFAGINSARGCLAESLGDLLVFDVDGSRTASVLTVLDQLVADPVLSVRSQVAHTVGAVLRFARPAAVAAFSKLVEADDELLSARYIRELMLYIGNGGSQNIVVPVIHRMVSSNLAFVRQCGGELALVAALNWNSREALDRVMGSNDPPSRRGVAEASAARLSHNRDAVLAAATLIDLFNDSASEVRDAAASVAPNLRGQALRPYDAVLTALIDSPTFGAAVPQLFLTLQHAPDDVGELALRSAQRFIEVFGAAAGDMRTSAPAHSRYVCDLVIRGLAQTDDAVDRAALLDVVDELVKVGAYGISDAIDGAGR